YVEEVTPAAEEVQNNTLTEAEKEEGWILLFNGENSEGWRGYNKENFPAAWEVADGTLHIQGSGRGEAGAEDGGDILYAEDKFGDFHLKIDWKISEGGNSGIIYFAEEGPEYAWMTAPEMQVLDNENHPDAEKGKNGNRKAGSLYDVIPADPQTAKPHGELNHAEIIVRGDNVKHILNGKTVVEYTIGSEELEALIADSKWPAINENWSDFAEEGYIVLQDHGDDAWYRNIKIKKLEVEE
ncbi:MAG: DUF1080 domain-containing protein, partial [Fulvivirga sp.]|nr:DUF1080 domain-containing protein [Fulvivirga sp.]